MSVKPVAPIIHLLRISSSSSSSSSSARRPPMPPTPRIASRARSPRAGRAGGTTSPLDASARRLYVSRGTRVAVLNADSGAPEGEIPNTEGVHGIALAPDLGRGFTSNGRANTVTIFDPKTLATLGTVKVPGENPDAILYDPLSHRVFTFNGRTANVTAIEGATGAVAGTFAVGGKPEFAVTDLAGRVYVNIEDKNEIVAFDSRTSEGRGALDSRGLRFADGSRDRREGEAPLLGLWKPGPRRPQHGGRPRRREGADRQGHGRRGLRSRREPRLQLERRRHPDRHPRGLARRVSRRPEPRDEGRRAHDGLRPEDARDLPPDGALRASPAGDAGESALAPADRAPAASRSSWPRPQRSDGRPSAPVRGPRGPRVPRGRPGVRPGRRTPLSSPS